VRAALIAPRHQPVGVASCPSAPALPCLERTDRIAHGLLTGAIDEDTTFERGDRRAASPLFEGDTLRRNVRVVRHLERVADDLGATVSALAIAWVLANPVVDAAIVGARSADHIEDSVSAAGIRLGDAEPAEIDAILTGAVTVGGPSPETVCADHARDIGGAAGRAVYRRVVAGSTIAALLEREREVDALRHGFDRARAGEGTLILIEGPAGVGKTELTRAARAAGEQAGLMPLEAKGSELEQPFAFGVVRQLLEPVINRPDADLFTGAAGPAARLFEPDEGPPADDDAGFEALHSLYWLTVNLADQAPLLVLVDDCQWADRESLRFLSYLAQRIEGLPVTLLLAGRPPDAAADEAGALWAQVASRPSAVALHPLPLSRPAATALARERLGDEAAEEFCHACHTATGGNPLFLRELLSALDAAGVAPSAAAATEVQAVGPAAVSRFVLHRLATLGPAVSELARAVAVLGDDSELRLVARVSGVSEDAARAGADELVRADIFARGARLGFVHPIVRAALYEDIGPGERGTRHAAAAEALAGEGAPPERLTTHLLLTEPSGDQRTVETLRAAASGAARRGAPRAAAVRLRRALAEPPDPRERGEILAELGGYEVPAMEFEAADEHLREALVSGAPLTTRAEAAGALARCAMVSGRSAEAAAAALMSLGDELRPLDPERSLELGAELMMLTRISPALRDAHVGTLERFREQARGHPGFEAVARIHGAHERLVRGGSDAASVVEEVETALAAGLPASAARGTVLLALSTLRIGERYDTALRMLDFALERARAEGHAARQGVIYGQRAAIELAQGMLHDAQVDAETGLLLVEDRHFVMPQLLAVAIGVHVERGDLDTADELAKRGDALGIGEDRAYVDEYLVARGRLRIARGQVEQGVADLMWCGERLEALELSWLTPWRVFAAPALASLGDTQTAAKLAREQLGLARSAGTPGALGRSLRAAAHANGGDDGLPLLEEAVSVLERSAARLELAHAFADLGAELTRARRRREAREAQRRAMELAGECGATALAERARADLQAGPGRRARIELRGPGALTAAEWRVCRQAAEGHTNREVAEALYVAEKTVERHLSSAYHKLGIRSRFQLPAAIGQ
jgi:DNA-binding CsgD family transcriptional regulator